MKRKSVQSKQGIERIIEIAEPLFVWSLVLFIIIGSYLIPHIIILIVMIFNIHWIYSSFKITIRVVTNTAKVKVTSSIDWVKRVQELQSPDASIAFLKNELVELEKEQAPSKYAKSIFAKLDYRWTKHIVKAYLKSRIHKLENIKKEGVLFPEMKEIKHVIVVATAFEPPQLVARLLNTITNQSLVSEFGGNILILIGQEMENKDYMVFREKILELVDNKEKIKGIWFHAHQLNPDTETKGKSANVNCLTRELFPKVREELGWDPKKTMVHIVDTVIVLHPQYLANMTYEFCLQKDREYKIYMSCILYYNNIWEIPVPNRMMNTVGSLWNVQQLSLGYQYLPHSSYSTTLWMAEDVGYWDPKVVAEDYHYFYSCFYAHGDRVMSVPIYLFTGKDSAQASTYIKMYQNQYKQFERWAWGIADIGYIVTRAFSSKHIPFISRMRRMKEFVKNHFFWPTRWFIFVLGANLPFIVNVEFRNTILGTNLPLIIAFLSTIAIVFFLVILFVDIFIKPKKNSKYDNYYFRVLGFVQWIALPFVSFAYSAVPALSAHTKLLFGRYLEYKITEKVVPKEMLIQDKKVETNMKKD